jgi:diguanylate cyclase (GGDEF)-like protein/PAS domain S-box-containing protein
MIENRVSILLVEDDIIDQMAFKRMISLDEPEYDYSIAGSTAEAKELLKNNTYDIVIVDYNLGDGTAFDIVGLIVDTPIIIVTGMGDEEMAVRALKAGAFHYLVKDNDRNYLEVMPSTIVKAIRHYRIERERKHAVNELRKSEIKHRLLLSCFLSPVLGLKDDMTIFYCNRAYADLVGKQIEDLEDANLLELFPNIQRSNYYSAIKKVLKTGKKQEIEGKNGEKYFFTQINKTPWGILSIAKDVTEIKLAEDELKKKNLELEKAKRELYHLSRTDPLTKLPNRRDILEKIQYEVFRFERSKEPFTLIIGDIDDFKKVNDIYGHNAGDYVLETIAEIMQKSLRKQDSLSRWGGEEFLFMLPGTDLSGGKKVAENILQNINDFAYTFEDINLDVTMTLGVSLFDEIMSIDECIKKADDALYKGKKSGKNCVVAN